MSSKEQNKGRKVLVVDDDPESLRIIRKALEWNAYEVEVATTGEEAITKISLFEPHLVLLDVEMPGLSGIETLSLVRSFPSYVSTIFVSGKSENEDVVRGLDAGADDYVCKPFNPLMLMARIRCQLRIKDIRDELSRANARLKELADTDDLTGLFNMRSLYPKLDYELDRARRYGRSVAAIMMDMDFFKSVNDDNDHLFGSFVLSEVGTIIKENIRKVDFSARYGGDEFLIVLTETTVDGTAIFCERLRKIISTHKFENEHGATALTASIGFAITDARNPNVDGVTLVRYADHALYRAKEAGRNRVEHYDFASEAKSQTVNFDPKNQRRINKPS